MLGQDKSHCRGNQTPNQWDGKRMMSVSCLIFFVFLFIPFLLHHKLFVIAKRICISTRECLAVRSMGERECTADNLNELENWMHGFDERHRHCIVSGYKMSTNNCGHCRANQDLQRIARRKRIICGSNRLYNDLALQYNLSFEQRKYVAHLNCNRRCLILLTLAMEATTILS